MADTNIVFHLTNNAEEHLKNIKELLVDDSTATLKTNTYNAYTSVNIQADDTYGYVDKKRKVGKKASYTHVLRIFVHKTSNYIEIPLKDIGSIYCL